LSLRRIIGHGKGRQRQQRYRNDSHDKIPLVIEIEKP
jgi:hypothetical protein